MPQVDNSILEQPFATVKPPVSSRELGSGNLPCETDIRAASHADTQLPLLPNPVIHHKVNWYVDIPVYSSRGQRLSPHYGVSRDQRALSPQSLLQRFDRVNECLKGPLGLTPAQREVTLRLLRLWAYYGKIYPKESLITSEPGCCKATFWRTIRLLRDRNLMHVTNRFIVRPHAQISNLYEMRRLLIIIARYLAEHGVPFAERWLEPYLTMAGSLFWRGFLQLPGVEVADDSPGAG